MNAYDKVIPVAALRVHQREKSEAELRVQLAAAYRIFAHLGWDYLVFGHITVRVPGPEKHFLINPFGLRYDEVTASNLVKIDIEGRIIGESIYPVNPAGFIIHGAIHEAREDAHCIMHTHTIAGMTMAASGIPIRPIDFTGAAMHNRIAYHDFRGVHADQSDKAALLESLGDKNFLVLKNHGLLACGDTIPNAFKRLHYMETACRVQTAALAMNGPVVEVPSEIAERHAQTLEADDQGELAFAAFTRLMEKIDPSFMN